MSSITTEAILILFLLLLNGVFAMSEMALVAAKRSRLEQRAERGDQGARAALQLAAHPNAFLSTVQVRITLVGVLAGAYGGRRSPPSSPRRCASTHGCASTASRWHSPSSSAPSPIYRLSWENWSPSASRSGVRNV